MAQIIRVEIKFLEELTNVRTSRPIEVELCRNRKRLKKVLKGASDPV